MFSIIIPCKNYGNFLTKCVKSINIENKYLDEVLIINDNSSDNTNIIGQKLSKFNKIKFVNVNFNSLNKTINFAVNKINSDYFSRIDPDDLYHQNFFNILVNENIKNNYDYIYGDIFLIKNKKIKYIDQEILNIFNKFKYPLSNGNLVKKQKFLSVGGIDQNLTFKDDYDLWSKLIKSGSSIKYVKTPTFFYNRHDRNMSKNILRKNLTYLKLLIKNFI